MTQELQNLINLHAELNERSYARVMKLSKEFDETVKFILRLL